jgi:cholesterol transport system auxiliary component
MTLRLPRRRLLPAFGLLLGLGGCAALELAGGLASRQPPRLYQLSKARDLDGNLPRSRASLSVEVPSATAGLNTARIALRPTHTTLEYFADASWIDVAPVMVQQLLIESLESSGRAEVLGRELVGVRTDFALLTDIRDFQAEYDLEREPPQVRVRVAARLVQLPRRTSVASTTAERVVRAPGRSMAEVVAAFDLALRGVLEELTAWTIRRLARG